MDFLKRVWLFIVGECRFLPSDNVFFFFLFLSVLACYHYLADGILLVIFQKDKEELRTYTYFFCAFFFMSGLVAVLADPPGKSAAELANGEFTEC